MEEDSQPELQPNADNVGAGCMIEIAKLAGVVITWIACIIIGKLIEPNWGGVAAAAALPLTVQFAGSIVATLLIFMLGARAALWLLKQIFLLPLRLIRKPREKEPNPLDDISMTLPLVVFAITSFGCGALLGWLLSLLETASAAGWVCALGMGATLGAASPLVVWLGFEP